MITRKLLTKKPWWTYVHEDIQELLIESLLLLKKAGNWPEKFHDYAFVVFPGSKAYEGFLKKLFLDMGFISEDYYFGKRFRVGKALNPAIQDRLGRGAVHAKIVQFSGGNELADELWETWKECRNILFHWFPNEANTINLIEAGAKINKIINAIDIAYDVCRQAYTKSLSYPENKPAESA